MQGGRHFDAILQEVVHPGFRPGAPLLRTGHAFQNLESVRGEAVAAVGSRCAYHGRPEVPTIARCGSFHPSLSVGVHVDRAQGTRSRTSEIRTHTAVVLCSW